MSTAQANLDLIVRTLFVLQLSNKLYHWNTTSFARHKATDGFEDDLASSFDKFVETYSGRYNVKPDISSIKVERKDLSDTGIVDLFERTRDILIRWNELGLDSDLLNIRDELLANVNKTLYLFRLN